MQTAQISLSPQIIAWLDKEADIQKTNRNKIIQKILQESYENAQDIADAERILEQIERKEQKILSKEEFFKKAGLNEI